MTTVGNQFADTVLRNYNNLRTGVDNKALLASAAEIKSGHPQFEHLEIGSQQSCDLASVFLDLTNFTGRTFWDPPEDVARLAHAVLTGFTLIVQRMGGHVLGLRGDGVFAGFGPSRPEVCVAFASAACAASLDAVQTSLNPSLVARGIEPVQARAGADYGRATFVRSGTSTASEINVIGFNSNFAAKCEKVADSWEMVVGENFADYIQNAGMLTKHSNSPKRYTRNYVTKPYDFFDYHWRKMLPEVDSTLLQLDGSPLESLAFS